MKRLSVLLLVLFLLPGFSSALAATKPKPSPKENYPTEPGLHKDLAFTNAGQQRTFNLFIPSSYSKRGGKGMSLLFLLHGAGMDADEMSKNSMVEVAEAEGFITVIPD